MQLTWLGQAGFLVQWKDKKILIDPYLSNACGEVNPASFRRTPLDESYLHIRPDVIVLTHDHMDHTDMQTLEHYLPGPGGTLVLAGANAWDKVRVLGGSNNYVRFRPGTQWSWEGITFRAVPAEHSDPEAIGVVMEAEGKKYYFAGDTLCSSRVLDALPRDLYALFLPVNGKGNNMNATDAAVFSAAFPEAYTVPVHFGMFDELDPAQMPLTNKVIPQAYQPVRLGGLE